MPPKRGKEVFSLSKPFSRTTTSPSASVLVCVTGQRDCDRLIRAGKELADQKGWPVQVLCVLPTAAAGQALCEELEYLRSTARDYQADMNIYFHDDSAGCAAQVARSYHARIIFTGMAAEPINGFIDRLRRLLPQTPIAMVEIGRAHV